MSDLKEIDVTFLWKLATCEDGIFLKDLGSFGTNTATRKRLRERGLVEESSRRNPKTNRKSKYLELTDAGWAWLSENHDAPASRRSPRTADLFMELNRRLGAYLEKTGDCLADFMRVESQGLVAPSRKTADETSRSLSGSLEGGSDPARAGGSDTATFGEKREALKRDHLGSGDSGDSHFSPIAAEPSEQYPANDVQPLSDEQVADRIRQVYIRLANQVSGARVRLADLRSELSDISRDQLDRTLWQLEQDKIIVLNRLDNPLEISGDDREAAVLTPGLNEPRHIMHMEIATHV